MGLQGCSEPQILVGLRWLAKVAVFSGHGHEIARGHIRRLGPRRKMNADRARKLAVEAAREQIEPKPLHGPFVWKALVDRLSSVYRNPHPDGPTTTETG
jgi:hypothetical protein